MVILELFIFFSTILPMFHLINALLSKKRKTVHSLYEQKAFSLIIPCFNEENTVGVSIDGLLAVDYQNFEAIYVNDGSADDTMSLLSDRLDLCEESRDNARHTNIRAIYRSRKHGNIRVIDKKNGGKSEALNTGILYAKYDLVVTLDADSVLKKDALQCMNRAFDDKSVAAAGGAIHIMQGYDSSYRQTRDSGKPGMLIALQILEYLKGFYIYKMSLSKQKAMAIISGAFGVFKKDILIRAGGFRKSLGEDIDITMRIQRLIHGTDQKILYLPEALCYTQCPESWHDLRRQRMRWQKGFIDCAVHQMRFLLRTFLYRSVSFHFLVEALLVGVCSCLFTVFTYAFVVVMAFENVHMTYMFLLCYAFCMFFHFLYALGAIFISARYNRYPKPVLRQMGAAILWDVLFYRYFGLLMYLCGTVSYFWSRSGHDCWDKCARQKETYFALEL